MKCNLPLTYNSDIWAGLTSFAQVGCNDYLESIRCDLDGVNVLHVGTGTSSLLLQFHDVFGRIDGITIMDSEEQVADKLRSKYKHDYKIFRINKYDIVQFAQIPKDYHVIVDTNPKQYACCMKHWFAYFNTVMGKLKPGGMFITHTQGYPAHTDLVDALTTNELKNLTLQLPHPCEIKEITEMTNSYDCYPVIIKVNM